MSVLKKHFLWVCVLSFTQIQFACSVRDPDSETEEASPPEVPALEYAEDWTEIKIISGYAETNIDVIGHFVISRDSCYREAAGAVDLEDWNALAKMANAFVRAEPLSEPTCFQAPAAPYALDGTVEIKLSDNRKRPIFEVRGGEVCTYFSDGTLSRAGLESVNRILKKAFHEDCPSGP